LLIIVAVTLVSGRAAIALINGPGRIAGESDDRGNKSGEDEELGEHSVKVKS
jgi:hypothetical protein